MTEIRESHGAGQLTAGRSGYDQWLASRLRSPVTRPTLQLLQANEYYAIMDEQIRGALAGDATPEKSLGEVAGRWHSITKRIGVAKQMRAWRRAQGIRL